MQIPEHVLQFIWRFRLFRQFGLVCRNGERVEVVHPGNYNTDAGPDFLFAHLRINGQDWYGHIEIHVQSSDWELHGHDKNKSYNAVILHVVWEGDKDCYLEDGALLMSLGMKDLVEKSVLNKIDRLLQNNHWLPCSYGLNNVAEYQKIHVLNRMGIERLEARYETILGLLKLYRGDWERVCLSLMAGAFGMKVNRQVFMDLSEILSLKLIQKMKGNSGSVQAIFFGQAGFLKSYRGEDPYLLKLVDRYSYLQRIHSLNEISGFQWKFMRMRPFNFPTLKLAQLAAMYCKFSSWFSLVVGALSLDELKECLRELEVPEFWETHFHFEKESSSHSTAITEQSFHLLAINSFIPLLFAYGKYVGDQNYMDRAISWLESLKAENNSVSRRYKRYGLTLCNALETQAVLHMRSTYCDPKLCLECGIALAIIKRD